MLFIFPTSFIASSRIDYAYVYLISELKYLEEFWILRATKPRLNIDVHLRLLPAICYSLMLSMIICHKFGGGKGRWEEGTFDVGEKRLSRYSVW